ncbi:MAG: hypothetical protein Q9218_003858, partial [Villophora microphyllina]
MDNIFYNYNQYLPDMDSSAYQYDSNGAAPALPLAEYATLPTTFGAQYDGANDDDSPLGMTPSSLTSQPWIPDHGVNMSNNTSGTAQASPANLWNNNSTAQAQSFPVSQPALHSPRTHDGRSPLGTLPNPGQNFLSQPSTQYASSTHNPRKRQRESLGIPALSAETMAKSRRTTPSPAVTGNTTPASFNSLDFSHDPHLMELLGGNPRDDLAEMSEGQKTIEQELRAKREQESRDAEFARQLYEELNSEQPVRSNEPHRASSQSFLGSNGQIIRRGPSTPPALPQQRQIQPRPQTPHGFSSPQEITSSSPYTLPQRERVRSPLRTPAGYENYIELSSSPDEVGNTPGYGSTNGGGASMRVNSQVADPRGLQHANYGTHKQYGQSSPMNHMGNIVNTASNPYSPAPGGLGGTSVYGGPSNINDGSSAWNNMGAYGRGLANAASGAWTSAQTLLNQRLGVYPNINYSAYGQSAPQSSTAPAVIDLDVYEEQQSRILELYQAQTRNPFADSEELLEQYMDRVNYLTNDPTKTTAEIKDLLNNIRPDEELPPENREGDPEAMVYPLMEHQKLGLAWMKSMEEGTNKGGILADAMGLGKTIQALALMVSRKSHDPHCKTTLIVAPLALLKQWEREIRTKLKKGREHQLRTYLLHGTNRATSWEQLRTYDVVLTTYGTLSAELGRKAGIEQERRANPNWRPMTKSHRLPLLGDECKWYRVILDEAQFIKNKSTKAATGACSLQALTRFCMSGTPMQNSISELYSLIRFLRIKPYNELQRFTMDFTKPLKSQWDDDKRRAMQKLQALLKAVLLRRNKKSMIDGKPILNLPERTTEAQHAQFNEDEQEFYKALESQTQLQFNRYLRAGTVGRNYSNILVLLLRLRQACCHPNLIKDFGVPSELAELPTADLEKMAKELKPEVVARIVEQGDVNDHSGLECPVCMDATENATIFIPCGHNTCSECFARIADPSQAIADGEDGNTTIKCPSCRGKIMKTKITDYQTFKRIHISDASTEGDMAKEIEGFSDSDDDTTEDEDETTDDEGSDLDGFIVDDDVETTDGEEGYRKGKTPFEKSSKAPRAKKRKSKKKSDKGKGKAEAKAPRRTLAQLKKESLRNAKAKKKYVAHLRKEWKPSGKIDKTMEVLQSIEDAGQGEKTIIFSQFTSLLDLLEVPMFDRGWKYKRYDGSMTADARNAAVLAFCDDPECKIMLISLRAGNAGLNLVAASQVIIMDPFWNPYVEEQAIDRAHRIGQQREVKVHRVLVEGTVEDRILELQEKKRKMIESALDEEGSRNVGRLDARELGYLF